jgi:hypothetical protein
LADGRVLSSREIGGVVGLSKFALWEVLRRCWIKGLVLRSEKPFFEPERLNKGRAGRSRNLRPFHLYALRPSGVERLDHNGTRLVTYSESVKDSRGGNGGSKAKRILDFLRSHGDEAYYSREIADSLKVYGVRAGDVMGNLRRYEQKGQVYVRGYRGHDHRSPFKEGYLITWIGEGVDRDDALTKAVERTSKRLENRESTNAVVQRVHRVRDLILESSKLRDLVSFSYLQTGLGCSEKEADKAVKRAMQLYPDLKEVKLFDAYRYFYHEAMPGPDLNAAIELKKSYARKIGSQRFRVGHNWEAVADWFIDRFTPGAEFWSQQHRTSAIDPRRITIRLIESVNGRRGAAEVDRVWAITPSPFTPTTTYVLSCKWSVVHKYDVDDFFEVLKWSKEFGVDSPTGRQIRQGVNGVFAAGVFNPKEYVKMKDGASIPLPMYAARMNIQLWKASDFNMKLQERGCAPSINVQKICRIAKNEKEVRQILDLIWKDPTTGQNVLVQAEVRNGDLYQFEKLLEEKPPTPSMAIEIETVAVPITQET